jgi:hypothetical protein
MSISFTVHQSSAYPATPVATRTSNSFTPVANAMLYGFIQALRDGSGTLDIIEASNTGGLTTTRKAHSSETTGAFSGAGALFEAPVGGSPSSMTCTYDPFAGSADNGYPWILLFSALGTNPIQIKSGQIVTKAEDAAGSSAFSHTTNSLPNPVTNGNTAVLILGRNNDSAGAATGPAGWTLLVEATGSDVSGAIWTKTDFTGQSATISVCGNTVHAMSSLLFELEEVGGRTQEGFRFRNDDGSETTATWDAAQDTDVTAPLGANLRLRTLIDTSAADPPATAYTQYYKKSTDSVYIPVNVGSTITPTAPVIETTAETAVTTAGTSHAITLPASIAATDLVLLIMDIGSTSATLNALTDWTEILDESAANGLKILWYSGAGVPSNPTFTSSAATRSATIAYRISNADKAVTPQIGTTATGTSVNPDPPSVTPTSGTSKPYRFIAFFGSAGEEADDDTWVTAAPSGYTGLLQKACGTVGTNLGGLIGAASRTNTSGSAENPATFTMAVSAAWRAQTIIIHPIIPAAPPIYISPSANITAGGEATTAQLTPPSGKSTSDFVTGRMWDDENGTDTIDVTLDDYTEVEWSLQAQSPAVNGDIYQFRVYAGATPLTTYDVTPQWTIGTPAAPAPVRRRRPSLVYR